MARSSPESIHVGAKVKHERVARLSTAVSTEFSVLVDWSGPGRGAGATGSPAQEVRRLSVAEYRDRMAAGWIGQMVGVGWGAPTEFKFKGEIIPEEKVPAGGRGW